MRGFGRTAYSVVMALLLVSCTQKPLDPGAHDPVADSDVAPTPVNVRLSVTSASVTIDWDVLVATGITEYRVYRAEGTGAFRWLASTSAQTYVDAAVVTGVTYRYQVSAIKGGLEGARSASVTAVPDVFGIVLEGGAEATSASSVAPGSFKIVVGLLAPPHTVSFRVSENPTLVGAAVQSFNPGFPTATFQLTQGDGLKTVYAKFTTEGGSVSELVSASIILDTKAVILQVTEDSAGQILTVDDVLHVAVAVDSTGGTVQADIGDAAFDLELFDDGTNGDAVAFDGMYERDFTVTAGVEVVEGVVLASFTDAVGNAADDRSAATKVTIADPPAASTFDALATVVTGASIQLVWSRNLDSDFAEYRLFRAPGTTVTELDTRIATITTQGTLTHTDSALTPGATFTWGIVVVDDNGFRSPLRSITDTVGADPVLSGITLSPSSGTQSTSFQWDCVYRHADNSAPTEINVVVDGQFILPMAQVGGGTNWVGGESFRVNANLATGPHTHYLEAVAADGSRTRNPANPNTSFNGPLVTN